MLGIHGQKKSKTITIDQGLIEKSFFVHHSIKLLLNCNASN